MLKGTKKSENKYEIRDGYAVLIIDSSVYGTVEVKVDEEDLPLLRWHQWSISKSSTKKNHPQLRVETNVDGSILRLHHLLVGKADKGMVVDHENRDSLDNRKSNLRKVSYSVNRINSDYYVMSEAMKKKLAAEMNVIEVAE